MSQLSQKLGMLIIVIGCSYVLTTNGQECSSFDCGNGVNLSYPFWSVNATLSKNRYCGYPGFGIDCSNGNPILTAPDKNTYLVRSINYSEQSLAVVETQFMRQTCPRVTHEYSIVSNLRPSSQKTLFYFSNCNSYPPASLPYVSCLGSTAPQRSYVFEAGAVPDFDWRGNCKDVFWIPVTATAPTLSNNGSNYGFILQLGLEMEWFTHPDCVDCEKTGQCGYDEFYNKFACLCSDGLWHNNSCPGSYWTKKRKVIYGVSLGTGALVILIILVVCRRKISSYCLLMLCIWNTKTRKDRNVEAFLDNYGHLAPHRHTYSDLKKMTNGFKDKLGHGGYGSVFKGKLRDGRFVAVKILSETKGNGDEFINEVSTIGRTNHVNIVSLIGFCSEGAKRALVYEYMPNGSLEKFIYSEKSTSETHPLGLEKLYQIALGIANGLEYLHRGCNTRILHFDIKPHNILLDEDFCPKISDFGLAKLCTTRSDIVSMPNPRGTIGYVAPEVYYRNLGGVSPKSDVYGYGMMVLEMVGGRKNINPLVEKTSEIYFPQWIYNRLQEEHGNIGLSEIKELFEEESIKKMIIVGLWCIQTHPRNRPSMSMVIDMLERNVSDLQLPPKPFQDPPTASLSNS